jgi:hypothetical protein
VVVVLQKVYRRKSSKYILLLPSLFVSGRGFPRPIPKRAVPVTTGCYIDNKFQKVILSFI